MSRRYSLASAAAVPILDHYFPRVAQFLRLQISGGGFSHFFSAFKLTELAMLLDITQPRTILELGSGSTTAMFADYADRTESAVVISVDQSEEYLTNTFQRLNECGLNRAQRVRPVVATAVIEVSAGKELCRYEPVYLKAIGDRPVDLLYVDGPAITGSTQPPDTIPCIDCTYIAENHRPPANVVFDYRLASVRHMRDSKFGYLYAPRLHFMAALPEEEPWVVDRVRHHSWFHLRSNSQSDGTWFKR